MNSDALGMLESPKRLREILDRMIATYGTRPWNWHTGQRPFEVLIGTVLSQRTRDDKTDEAARALLFRFPTAAELAVAPVEHIERLIRPSNYYKTKAVRIQAICRALLDRHGGEVPSDPDRLRALPGVGRKTAACVMVYGFGKPAIPVDVHVHRLANRMGLIHTRSPEESETALWGITHSDHVLLLNELFVKHGQTVCRSVRPKCDQCGVRDLCEYGVGVSVGNPEGPKRERGKPSQRAGESDRPIQSDPRQVSSKKEKSPISR
ncbi:MAG: endonuclease III [Syntrophobacteraceae bacterium]